MILLQRLMTNSIRHQVSGKVLYSEKQKRISVELQAGQSDAKSFILKIFLHDYCIYLKIQSEVK